jgi:hypothetical protein
VLPDRHERVLHGVFGIRRFRVIRQIERIMRPSIGLMNCR